MGFPIVRNFFTLDDLQRSKIKVKTPKTLKSNISKTVRYREMVTIEEVKKKIIYGLPNGINCFNLG